MACSHCMALDRNWGQWVTVYYHQSLEFDQTHGLLLFQSCSLNLSCSRTVQTCHYGLATLN